MSFTSDIKSELAEAVPQVRSACLAELSALTVAMRQTKTADGGVSLSIFTENEFAARKYFTLFRKSLKVYIGVCVRTMQKKRSYILTVTGREAVDSFMRALKMEPGGEKKVSPLLCKDSDGRRAALRGYFLSCGRINDPQKGYHLEMTVQGEQTAEQIVELLGYFSLEGRITSRNRRRVVYIKDSESIADFLKVVGAVKALLWFENARVYKDMRGRVNRKVNCEAANITKTVSAAARQREDIILIEKNIGLSHLPAELRDMAELRLDNPDATLAELGDMFSPPLGKSGVNHRLRRLSKMADPFR
ncbi:MAG: DNA-binding protein WhiA [Lachnospiraceae bacterium]|nr:DNA-binding protein WhiA [Lachnospiraceae bacterium]